MGTGARAFGSSAPARYGSVDDGRRAWPRANDAPLLLRVLASAVGRVASSPCCSCACDGRACTASTPGGRGGGSAVTCCPPPPAQRRPPRPRPHPPFAVQPCRASCSLIQSPYFAVTGRGRTTHGTGRQRPEPAEVRCTFTLLLLAWRPSLLGSGSQIRRIHPFDACARVFQSFSSHLDQQLLATTRQAEAADSNHC